MKKNTIGISDDAVKKATGKSWDQWVEFLDKFNAEKLSHKEIVSMLKNQGEIESGWWQQSVAVAYEKIKGKRITGQTKDAGFQLGAQKTVPLSPEQAWDLITSPAAIRIWLGKATGFKWEKGETYRIDDGTTGEVRVVHPNKHARITFKPGHWSRASTIQVRVEARGEKTVIGFHEENLPGIKERDRRRDHFRTSLDQLESLI